MVAPKKPAQKPKPKAKAKVSQAKSSNAAVMPSMAKEDKQWRAQDDVRILREAEKIRVDRERLAMAKNAAKAEMQALKKVVS
jgi:hypothetical protein